MSLRPNHLEIASAFDKIAAHYDSFYGSEVNPVMSWMRAENFALLQNVFPVGSRLLEIGAGTGEEAIRLAKVGYTVLASDISPEMTRRTAARARREGLQDRVTAVALAANRLDALSPLRPFDGAFASFGSLNSEPDLAKFVSALAELLRPKAKFVCTVMARVCLFEQLWYLLNRQPRLGMRRLQRGWQNASISGAKEMKVMIPVRYFTVSELKQYFQPTFSLIRHFALPLLLPPPYLASLYLRFNGLFNRLEPVERWLRELWPWKGSGDHLALVFRKR